MSGAETSGGLSATSWPMLLLDPLPDVMATLSPVAPAAAFTKSAAFARRALVPPLVGSSYRSSVPNGETVVLMPLCAKNATTRSSAAVVVTEGATIWFVYERLRPLCASIGRSESTPRYARMAPAAPTGWENFQVHVYDSGSELLTTLKYRAWASDAYKGSLLSRRITVHPGGVAIGAPAGSRTARAASMTSPAAMFAGTARDSEEDGVEVAAVDVDESIGAAGAAGVASPETTTT
ncbi:MAG TPA: hypothetical protein VFM13_05125 [Gaiellaceae bacterium]|nr:hypothetical protein [Gaiellaceae bacterium]